MRKTLALLGATAALTFGGAGIANATVDQAPTTVTTVADNDNNNTQHSDKTGLWGLTGLLGLAGLAGRRRRNDAVTEPPAVRRPGV